MAKLYLANKKQPPFFPQLDTSPSARRSHPKLLTNCLLILFFVVLLQRLQNESPLECRS